MPFFYTNAGFFNAIAEGNLEKVQNYMEHHSDFLKEVDDDKNTPLHCAAVANQVAIAAYLLSLCIPVDITTKSGETPLMRAAANGAVPVVKLLLEEGADPKLLTLNGGSALKYAVSADSLQTAKLLLEAGADAKAGTLLVDAMRYDHYAMAELLLAAGASPQQHTPDYMYPLHYAAQYDNIDMIEKLLAAKAEVDVRNDDARTPLRSAVLNNKLRAVELLLNHGANPDIVDNSGVSPMSYATENKSKTLILLSQFSGNHKHPHVTRAPKPPRPTAAGADTEEQWLPMGADSVAFVGEYQALGQKLTHIFNFMTQDYALIVYNLSSGQQNLQPSKSFEEMPKDSLRRAFNAYKEFGGKIEEEKIFGISSDINRKEPPQAATL